jgi:Arc/MetJ-type ribon-helix-helix transcriptional regulator
MTLSLPPELERSVETEIATGDFHDSNEFVEEAVRSFLSKRRYARLRKALGEIGDAIDAAGLRDQGPIPADDDD